MHINKSNDTYSVEMNNVEYVVFKKVFSKLIFNPEGVSNYFKLIPEEIEEVRKMNGTLYGIRY
jgi:hypothetical protein